ncbi:MAG TPA: hypothetical protein VJ806_07120 [Luteimonas sp.]|nr:hypothetical protein [Luteimonas sp.]
MRERSNIEAVSICSARRAANVFAPMRPIIATALAIAALFGPMQAAAQARKLTEAEIVQIRNLLGFTPEVTLKVVRMSLEQQPELKRYDAAKQDCLLKGLQPEVDGKLQQAFGDLFEDSETIAAWLRFADTPGGGKLVGAMRMAVTAKVDGGMVPNPLGMIAGMTDAERADVTAFMESPASAVLKKDFPDMEQPTAFGEATARRCGIAEWKEN